VDSASLQVVPDAQPTNIAKFNLAQELGVGQKGFCRMGVRKGLNFDPRLRVQLSTFLAGHTAC
jgi:hypothetical protein